MGAGTIRDRIDNDTEQDSVIIVGVETDEKFSSTEINKLLDDVLKDINDHDYDKINQHKNTIIEKLKGEFDINDIRYGGSHSTRTDINKLSDIDLLADLGEFTKDSSSNDVIDDFAVAIRERLPSTTISTGAMAVTVKFSDGLTIQILPAFQDGECYRIPDPSGGGWVETYPKRFAKKVTQLNQEHSNQIVPIIKLVKLICNTNNIAITSYHVSNLVLNTFSHIPEYKNRQKMLQYFFNQAKSLCLQPTPDPSGQTTYIDGDISEQQRQELAQAFDQVENQINDAISLRSLEKWKDLFNK